MNKEKVLPAGRQDQYESGFSEKQLDLATDKTKNSSQVKAGNIFDATKKDKGKKA